MFDAFSPARNPAMWTLPLFTNLFRLLDPRRPCVLPTYSRSTILRTTLLLAGFFVGVGHATGEKEETTVAANTLDYLIEPLDRRWLERVHRSSSAEPLTEAVYRQSQTFRWKLGPPPIASPIRPSRFRALVFCGGQGLLDLAVRFNSNSRRRLTKGIGKWSYNNIARKGRLLFSQLCAQDVECYLAALRDY